MTAGDHGWRPFEPSADDCERAFRNAIAAVFDDINDQQVRRDIRRRLVSLLMHVAIVRIVGVFLDEPTNIRDARLEVDENGGLVLDYVFDMPIREISFAHTVIL